jgi:hypothetical protein
MILLNLFSLKETFSSFSGIVSAAALAERFNSEIFKFTNPLNYLVKARKIADYFELKAKIELNFLQFCGRCCEFQQRLVLKDFTVLIKIKTGELKDDVDLYLTDSEVFNLEDFLLEQLVLEADIFWAPQLTEKNACTRCNKTFTSTHQCDGAKKLFDESVKAQIKKKLNL